jgi:mitogen-activated protein kinase 1/3
VHRDIKPSNILLDEECNVRLCDFGMACSLSSPDKLHRQPSDDLPERGGSSIGHQTRHVVTRWYRAPEVILLKEYGFPVDMWSAGCVMAEMFLRRPLFPGGSCHPMSPRLGAERPGKRDQLSHIFSVIDDDDIERMGLSLSQQEYVKWIRAHCPHAPRGGLSQVIEEGAQTPVSKGALDLLEEMLRFHPSSRIRVDAALRHPFFQSEPLREEAESQMKDCQTAAPVVCVPRIQHFKRQLYLDAYLWQATLQT